MRLLLAAIFSLGTIASQAAEVPDPRLTPGLIDPNITKEMLCGGKMRTSDYRNVTEAMKKKVFAEYGFRCGGAGQPRCGSVEVDHLVPLWLGGANGNIHDLRNLWPQSYSGRWNAHDKDRVENGLHAEVCRGGITLEAAQEQIRTDWRKVYVRLFGKPKER